MDPHLLQLRLQQAGGKHHVDGSVVTAEAATTFRQEALLQMVIVTVEKNTNGDFSDDVEQQDSSVIVAELAVPLLPVEMDV
nr:unnamed protein product [Spirometra erinaceieuropaei]